eukprot:TRINITY_DN1981_c0_g1_i1.p4 TRINITY_DN1981_c0_g1~~TRINITY_DN1981_c0_g1_i1.p4  ORF type:complete len:118 (-),score=4.72 TRINITY_DN1981_c0_g1_i1:50-403(-)
MVAAPSNLAKSGSVSQGYVESGRLEYFVFAIIRIISQLYQLSFAPSSFQFSYQFSLWFDVFFPVDYMFQGILICNQFSLVSFSLVQSSIQHAVAYVETVVVCRILWFAVVDFMVCSI